MGSCWTEHLDCPHRDYIGLRVTLNGEPAKIVLDDDGSGHPLVAPLDPTKGNVPYSWTTVFNIVGNRQGRF